ncbi:NADH:flavin oxidoreductase/NADH oxidase [Penicillium herquei]|nr:NADH:flavin oxidoreductase/NADH oxidase [Penicillium herquei]
MVMTCSAHVNSNGQAVPGQLGICDDIHLPGLRRIAFTIRKNGPLSSVQLHHGGVRALPELSGQQNVGPSDYPPLGGQGLSLEEVYSLRNDFINAAKRAEAAGFDGIEVHAAFGWVLIQFLSPMFNKRNDQYGGSLENRSRFLFEVIDGIRVACRPDFQIGLRISMERYGLSISDIQEVAKRAILEETIDYLDLAVWD